MAMKQVNKRRRQRGWSWVIACVSAIATEGAIALPLTPLPVEMGQAVAQETRQQEVLTQAEVYRLQNSVEILPRNQSVRPARLRDQLVPLDALRTAATALAELLFNEGSLTRVDQNTTFYFRQGLRRFQLDNRMARAETIFVLENGTAMIISPPNGSGTQVETPGGRISIVAAAETALATPPGDSPDSQTTLGSPDPEASSPANVLTPADRSTVAMVVHDASQNSTQVFALTDGSISVANLAGTTIVPLMGGQTVAIASGQVGSVQEFDLAAFYNSVPLAAGLGAGQESQVQQEPAPVQATLNLARIETLAALSRQTRELAGFSRTFLRDALSGSDSDFSGQRGATQAIVIDPVVTPGTFTRTGENTAVFTDANQNRTPIRVDFDTGRISINGNAGVANSAGLSGNNAVGTVVEAGGRVVRVQVFGVGGDEPDIGQSFRGSLTTGIAPDR
ncbi:MAG: hypothetical protein HY785_19575 [Oscillatoriophycideae cyanobacterium NC_groundwater_1537_Pr4_S-0.65um_50_18]|nr:hypothetical protein [Oscillatoriophycideae cyanobacterium NC_groundwater_1537_Pr4_S-0.65um_50_18]